MTFQVWLSKSSRQGKKYSIKFTTDQPAPRIIHFGQAGASDYTIHKDDERKQRYIDRHSNEKEKGYWKHNRENLKKASYWSRWLLWEKKSLNEAIKFIEDKQNIVIKK